jgi:hypothetical protein
VDDRHQGKQVGITQDPGTLAAALAAAYHAEKDPARKWLAAAEYMLKVGPQPDPPTYYANNATIFCDQDQMVLIFHQFFQDLSGIDPNKPGKLQPTNSTGADMLASPRVARIVTTFTVAAVLHKYLEDVLPFIRKVRAAPPAIQGQSSGASRSGPLPI